jgi:cytochrome oxidase Cu insertion factor (SCO1/SenC/PrrC family)
MRTRMLVAAAIAFAVAGGACTRQEPTPSSQRTPIAVGDTAPAFALKSASGGTVSLSDYAGKPVLLYFSMGPG